MKMAFQEAWPKLFLISVTRSIFFCGSNKGEKKPCHQKITFSKKNCFKNCAPAISISVIALWSQILKKKMYSLSTRLTSEFSYAILNSASQAELFILFSIPLPISFALSLSPSFTQSSFFCNRQILRWSFLKQTCLRTRKESRTETLICFWISTIAMWDLIDLC